MKALIWMAAVALQTVISFNAHASEELLQRFFADVTTVKAGFKQHLVDETGMTLERSTGTFYLSRPGQFRWDYQSDDPEIAQGKQIIADGKLISMYDPDMEQMTQRSLDDALAQVPSLLLVQSGVNVEDHFNITDIGMTDGLSWVLLKPKDPNASYEQLMIGFLKDELNTITMIDGLGNETRLVMLGLRNNVELDSQVFSFVPPEGTDIWKQ